MLTSPHKMIIQSYVIIKQAHVLEMLSHGWINVSHIKVKLPHAMLISPHKMIIQSHVIIKQAHVLDLSSHVYIKGSHIKVKASYVMMLQLNIKL